MLDSLEVTLPDPQPQSQLAGFALFCQRENLTVLQMLHGYAYSWLENQVTAGIKLVPLGQSEGQAILYQLVSDIEGAVACALQMDDADLGYTSPALAMASAFHETQYCRLFRS